MKNECNVIKDILPLYVENIVSDDTKTFVEEHLANCSKCKQQLKVMKTPSKIPTNVEDVVPLKNLRRKLFKKRIATIILTIALVLAILITTFSFLTSPNFLSLSEDRLSFTKGENDTIIISFDDSVTGYNVEDSISEDGETYEYHISAWNTTWDQLFQKRGTQNYILKPIDGEKFTVYYSQNNSTESIYVYGTEPSYGFGVILLPRLVLSYYIILTVLIIIILAILLIIFRKKPVARIWIKRVLLFPVSYILGHICIKGFKTATYSCMRDFSLIMLITILLYTVFLLGHNLYLVKKERSKNACNPQGYKEPKR